MHRGKGIGIAVGVLLILGSVVFFLVTLLGFADPAGAKGADDNDPFGAPPSRPQLALEMLVSIGIGACGLWLVYRSARRT